MQMQGMNQFGNRGYGGPPQPQRQGGRRGNNRGGFRNSRFEHNNQNQRNQNHGQGGQRPNIEVSEFDALSVCYSYILPFWQCCKKLWHFEYQNDDI